MKRVLTFILTMAFCYSMMGGPIDETTAKQLAQNFWKENNIMAVKGGKVYKQKMDEARFVNVAAQHGYSAFYIFNNTSGKGYVIMSADDCVAPILGYSYEHSFDDGELPPNLKEWLDGYALQIEEATAMKLHATQDIRTDWECLRQVKPLPVKSEKAVTPLIQTQWNQAPYYNDLCPYDYEVGSRALTGCVATAMAQVMKYWSYPEHGYGSHSYVPYTHPEYGTQYADFSSVNYQWSSMPNSVYSANNAVATLMYHCGVSVEMRYGPTSSGAYVIDYNGQYASAEVALKTYFDYNSNLHSIQKINYSDAEWVALLKEELDNARPMVYAGYSESSGHAFVCDGYNNSNYFHFNWGWGGSYDDYFYINSLNPGSHTYSQNQQALVGVEPNQNGGGGGGGGSTSYELVYTDNVTMTETDYWFYDDLYAQCELANTGGAGFTGYIGAGVFRKDENGEYVFFCMFENGWDFSSDPLQPGETINGHPESAGGPPYLPGSYVVAMLYSLDGNLWNMIDNNGYENAMFEIIYEQDIETFSDFTITSGDYLYSGTTATVNVGVWNSGSTTFYGKLCVSLSNLDVSWAQNIAIIDCSDGLEAGCYYDGGLDFTGLITVEPGSYYMELAYQDPGDSDWYYAGAYAYQNPVRTEVVAAPVTLDPYESNDSASSAYTMPCAFTNNSATISTTGANFHSDTDVDYYKIDLNASGSYYITPCLYDAYNSEGDTYYTADAMFAYSTDGVNWSDFYDDVTSEFTIDPGTLYFCVRPYFEGFTGTYQLDVNISYESGGGGGGGGDTSDPYEYNDDISNAYTLPYTFSGNSATIRTTGANIHDEADVDYYKIEFASGRNYTITPRLYDAYNTDNYTVDAIFFYSIDGNNWEGYFDDEEAASFTVNSGTVYFCVMSYYEGEIGTYLLQINITSGTGMEESDVTSFSVYPNPVKDVTNIHCEGLEEISLFNAEGQKIESMAVEGRDNVQIDLSDLPNGVYILRAVSQDRILTRRIMKAE